MIMRTESSVYTELVLCGTVSTTRGVYTHNYGFRMFGRATHLPCMYNIKDTCVCISLRI